MKNKKRVVQRLYQFRDDFNYFYDLRRKLKAAHKNACYLLDIDLSIGNETKEQNNDLNELAEALEDFSYGILDFDGVNKNRVLRAIDRIIEELDEKSPNG